MSRAATTGTRKAGRRAADAPLDPTVPVPDSPAALTSRKGGRSKGGKPGKAPKGGKAGKAPVAPPPRHGVNLVSPWVLEQHRVRHLRRRFVYGVGSLVLVLGLVGTGMHFALAQAEAELSGEQAVTDGLQLRISALDDVSAYVSSVRGRGLVTRTLMSTQVDTAAVVKGLDKALPDGAELASLTFTLAPAADTTTDAATTTDGTTTDGAATDATAAVDPDRGIGATCAGPDPFGANPVLTCVSIAGTAPDRQAVARLVERLESDEMFSEPFITTTTAGEDGVTFAGTVGVTSVAFTGTYDDLASALLPPLATAEDTETTDATAATTTEDEETTP
ncbi:hypothetical protein [Nocardioides bruguierae]|uniref:Uncharacterized protein n=1 Tax=Nocardioides bruguierae TaxID=2945102 RepID=A0A9X2DBL5_9ACTN|nr:hypothetical protein [Nocardioides bruguierae]MCM0622382.1 hypothetical protein [Nocardioides bruguierae]